MKTTIELPDELMREVKIRAAVEGRKLKDTFADILRSGLKVSVTHRISSQNIRIEADAVTGLPTVPAVTDSPGADMTLTQIKRLEQNSQYLEDLQHAGLSL